MGIAVPAASSEPRNHSAMQPLRVTGHDPRAATRRTCYRLRGPRLPRTPAVGECPDQCERFCSPSGIATLGASHQARWASLRLPAAGQRPPPAQSAPPGPAHQTESTDTARPGWTATGQLGVRPERARAGRILCLPSVRSAHARITHNPAIGPSKPYDSDEYPGARLGSIPIARSTTSFVARRGEIPT
jgi:hypothetical protein